MKHLYAFLKLVLISLPFYQQAFAQDITQVAYGTIIDNSTQEPLQGVAVELLNYMPLKTTVTNNDGQFQLKGIPVGKHRFLISHDDYDIVIVPEIQITAGKEAEVNVTLEKLPEELAEIVVKADKIKKTTKDNPINHMALTGIRSFTIEEVKRYPSSLEDPARLIAKFAGVNKTHAETGLLVRGNNVQNILWRIEGLPTPSPNHLFFNEGATGYLPIFNIYLLRNSDFMHGVAPAEYGNTLGGTIDIGLRNGNMNNYAGSFKFGLLGLEGFAEGPLDKNGKASFIIGGRYGWFSLIANRVGGALKLFPDTKDLSFKVHIKMPKGELNVFGIGGLSSFLGDVSSLDSNASAARFSDDMYRHKTYGFLGANYKHFLESKKGYINTTIGTNYNLEHFKMYDSTSTIDQINSSTISNTISSYLHYVVNLKHQIRTGITASHYYLNFNSFKDKQKITVRDFQGHTLLLQVHAQWLYKINKRLKINLGVNGQYLALNNTYGVSPRFALSWQMMASHRLSFGYSWNQQIQTWETYFNQSNRFGDRGQMVDFNLGFSQNHHFSLAYDWAILNNWRLKVEGYFQYLDKMPINTYEPSVSLININSTENLLEMSHFSNNGIGHSYGAELTLEKFFSNGYYGLLTATYFDVKYQAADGIWRNTATNNHFMGNLLVGKEFKIGKEKNNSIFIDLGYTFRMGNYYTPVDLNESLAANRHMPDWTRTYSLQHPSLHMVDLRVGIFINQKKRLISHKFFIEVTNLLNQRVPFREAYNPYRRQVVKHIYPGIVPNITYRINFAFKKKDLARSTPNAPSKFM